jgi:hypothetical protein
MPGSMSISWVNLPTASTRLLRRASSYIWSYRYPKVTPTIVFVESVTSMLLSYLPQCMLPDQGNGYSRDECYREYESGRNQNLFCQFWIRLIIPDPNPDKPSSEMNFKHNYKIIFRLKFSFLLKRSVPIKIMLDPKKRAFRIPNIGNGKHLPNLP